MSGFIKLHRGWRDTDGLMASKDFSDFEAWLWILENAAWKDGHRFNAKGEMVPIGRGQMHVSIRSLQSAFGWSKTRVERFLGRLKTVAKVTLEAGQSGTIITVCNYEKYQGISDSDKPSHGTASSPATGQSRDTHKEGKEGKEGKKEPKGSIATPLPENWKASQFSTGTKSRTITDGWTSDEWQSHLEHFIAHHRARGSKFKDWQDAWSTWVLNSAKYGRQANGTANRTGAQQRDGRSSLARAIDEGLDWLDGTQASVS
jgi:hypothetical protein